MLDNRSKRREKNRSLMLKITFSTCYSMLAGYPYHSSVIDKMCVWCIKLLDFRIKTAA